MEVVAGISQIITSVNVGYVAKANYLQASKNNPKYLENHLLVYVLYNFYFDTCTNVIFIRWVNITFSPSSFTEF